MLPRRLHQNSRRQEDGKRCPAHRKWVRGHACSVPGCEGRPIECAHVRDGTDGGAGMKPSDWWTISLCREHHAEQHRIGEAPFERRHKIDLISCPVVRPHWRNIECHLLYG
jgi:hypothetical protein